MQYIRKNVEIQPNQTRSDGDWFRMKTPDHIRRLTLMSVVGGEVGRGGIQHPHEANELRRAERRLDGRHAVTLQPAPLTADHAQTRPATSGTKCSWHHALQQVGQGAAGESYPKLYRIFGEKNYIYKAPQ